MIVKIISLFSFIAIWISLTGIHLEPHIVAFVFIAPLLSFIFAYKLKLLPDRLHFRAVKFIIYFGWLFKEIVNSSIAVIKISWRKNLAITPSLEAIKTSARKHENPDTGIVAYANSITLTPGTVTLSIKDDVLLVHSLDGPFIDDLKTGQMEKKIWEVVK